MLVYVRLVASIERPLSGVRRRAPEPDSRWKSDERTSLFVRIAPPASVTAASGAGEPRRRSEGTVTATATGSGSGFLSTRSVRQRLPFIPSVRAVPGMTRR